MINDEAKGIRLVKQLREQSAALKARLSDEPAPATAQATDAAPGEEQAGSDSDWDQLEAALSQAATKPAPAPAAPTGDLRPRISKAILGSRLATLQWCQANGFEGSVVSAIASGQVVIEGQADD